MKHYGIMHLANRYPAIPRWVIYCICEAFFSVQDDRTLRWYDCAIQWLWKSEEPMVTVNILIHECRKMVAPNG